MSAESISRESWSVLVNCVVDAARTVARYLFPSDHELLLQSAARKLVNNVDEETRSHAKLEKAANSIAAVYMAAPKGSLQRRTARAFLVKSFPKEMIDSVVGIPNKSRQKSYEDYNKMEDGELLDVSRGGKARFNKETTEACVSWRRNLRLANQELEPLPADMEQFYYVCLAMCKHGVREATLTQAWELFPGLQETAASKHQPDLSRVKTGTKCCAVQANA